MKVVIDKPVPTYTLEGLSVDDAHVLLALLGRSSDSGVVTWHLFCALRDALGCLTPKFRVVTVPSGALAVVGPNDCRWEEGK